MRAFWPSQMRPLREPQVRVLANALAGHRKLFSVGNAVHPNRSCAQQLANPQREISRGGAGGNYNARPFSHQNPKHLHRHHQQSELVPTTGVPDDIKSSPADLRITARQRRHIGHIVPRKGGSHSQKLNPVAAARGDRKYPLIQFILGVFGAIQLSLPLPVKSRARRIVVQSQNHFGI